MRIRPHIAQNLNRPGGSAIDQRTARHNGYQISQKKRHGSVPHQRRVRSRAAPFGGRTTLGNDGVAGLQLPSLLSSWAASVQVIFRAWTIASDTGFRIESVKLQLDWG